MGAVGKDDETLVIRFATALQIATIGFRQRSDHHYNLDVIPSLTLLYSVHSHLTEFRHLSVYFDRMVVVTRDSQHLTFFDLRTGKQLGEKRLLSEGFRKYEKGYTL